ncbi:MAG: hypothetical protein LIO94_05945 [Clostridiales bacterium]|nr:hypothetical protein [Clostridiales bacterium]
MPEHVYKKSVEALPFRASLTAVFSAAAVAGELVNLFWKSQYDGSILGAVLYILAEAVGLTFAILLRKQVLKLEWEEKKDKN